MQWTKLLTICTFLCLPKLSDGLDTLRVDAAFSSIDLAVVSGLYRSQVADEISIEAVSKLEDSAFVPLTQTGTSFSPTDDIYWTKTYLQNIDSVTRTLVVHFDNPRINKIQFFTVEGDNFQQTMLMGDVFPFKQREIHNRNFLHKIVLPPQSSLTLFVYANKAGEKIDLIFKLWDEEAFYEEESNAIIFYGQISGVGLCLCGFIILITIFFYDKIFLYFLLYCLAINLNMISYTGFGYQYLWGMFPYINAVSNYFYVTLYSVALIAMTRRFLYLKNDLPLLDNLLKLLQALLLSLLTVLFTQKILPLSVIIVTTYIGHAVLITYPILVIIAALLSYHKTKRLDSLLFVLGFCFFMAGFISHFGAAVSLFGNTLWARYGIGVGWLIDVIILTVIFSKRVKESLTEKARLREELNKAKLAAADTLIKGQIKERERLSRALHDGISIKMFLLKSQVQQLLKPNSTDTKEVIHTVEDVAKDIRNFTHAISPFNMANRTLVEAMEDLIYGIKKQTPLNISVRLHRFDENRMDDNHKQHLYQIFQELLNNTIKYAEATTVIVSFVMRQEELTFKYTDDGKGFDVNASQSGIGLKNIQARIALLNGITRIQADKDGSRFEFVLPVI